MELFFVKSCNLGRDTHWHWWEWVAKDDLEKLQEGHMAFQSGIILSQRSWIIEWHWFAAPCLPEHCQKVCWSGCGAAPQLSPPLKKPPALAVGCNALWSKVRACLACPSIYVFMSVSVSLTSYITNYIVFFFSKDWCFFPSAVVTVVWISARQPGFPAWDAFALGFTA